jgi:hypothetical protein
MSRLLNRGALAHMKQDGKGACKLGVDGFIERTMSVLHARLIDQVPV